MHGIWYSFLIICALLDSGRFESTLLKNNRTKHQNINMPDSPGLPTFKPLPSPGAVFFNTAGSILFPNLMPLHPGHKWKEV